MHDRNGTPLQVGDVVMVPYMITSLTPGADFCNMTAQSVYGRKPDGLPEYYSGNTAVCTLVTRDHSAAPYALNPADLPPEVPPGSAPVGE